ncbi:MAG: hypothetical protein JNL57_03780 [Bacteroidetes bacterium]|nr:hypothetical protein [Bacteroidota bacterium]
MNSYELKKYLKLILLLLAMFIGAAALFFSQRLVRKIALEEEKKIKTWALAEEILSDPDSEGDLSFHLNIVQDNSTIPAILVNEKGKIVQFINLDSNRSRNAQWLAGKLEEFKTEHEPILIPQDAGEYQKVYYGESSVLRQLRYYPFVGLAAVSLFMLVSYFAFNFSRRAEQNQVWVGLAKETAHQLGTPISSLMGWIDVLEMGELPDNAAEEMRKDIRRLNIITERFSKIGSEPVLKRVELNETIRHAVEYMQMRSGKQVEFEMKLFPSPIYIELNINLFDWVIENLTKNSIDAMEGKGKLIYSVLRKNDRIYVDVTDNGKGVPRNRFKTIFKPGFTTKKRGWGLGLSLARRIIHDYHKGEIFVKESVPFIRTTIRMVLNEVD